MASHNQPPYGMPNHDQYRYTEDPTATPPPPAPPHRILPNQHPNSNFQQMREERGFGSSSQQSNYNDRAVDHGRSQSPPISRRPLPAAAAIISPSQPPIDRQMSPSPPMHPGMGIPQSSRSPYHDVDDHYTPPSQSYQQHDGYNAHNGHNYAPAASAGGAAIGMGVGAAAIDARQGGPNSFSPTGNNGTYAHNGLQPDSLEHGYDGTTPYRNGVHSQGSYASTEPLATSAVPPAFASSHYPDTSYNGYSDRTPSPSRLAAPYQDSPSGMNARSRDTVNNMAYVDPNAILDDGDDFGNANPNRGSKVSLPFSKSKNNSSNVLPLGGAAVGAGAASTAYTRSPGYDPNPSTHAALMDPTTEKQSGWLHENKKNGTKWKKILFIILGIIIILGIAGGVAGGILSSKKTSKPQQNGQSAAQDDGKGDLSKDSAEIKKLLATPGLHKVFSGFAYTPFAAQYPDCLTYPPSQNNITRDIAMMSQLTNVIRLYGTDCNQTEMVLHAIDRLALTDMKIWLGVWLGDNSTTNTRQVDQMWKILDASGTTHIKGVVIGNEVLFRKDLTATQLGTFLSETKTNLTKKGMNLPVATSDLGDNWTSSLATEVDVVMSNIHPFFGGVEIDQAAAWTWSFWQSHDVAVTAGMSNKKHIISEFGWPSDGGNDCGTGATCASKTQGAVASVDNMNKLMSDWVCQALTNGTDYFWFEAFDEPWKIRYNTADQNWEDKWGLMDINRNLKKGIKIPDCGGQTAPKA